jgi:predicted nicotinamide N-methyase
MYNAPLSGKRSASDLNGLLEVFMLSYYTANRAGKSTLARMWKEAMLDAGETVVVFTPEGATRQKRKKHLTVIEDIKPATEQITVIYDDL